VIFREVLERKRKKENVIFSFNHLLLRHKGKQKYTNRKKRKKLRPQDCGFLFEYL